MWGWLGVRGLLAVTLTSRRSKEEAWHPAEGLTPPLRLARSPALPPRRAARPSSAGFLWQPGWGRASSATPSSSGVLWQRPEAEVLLGVENWGARSPKQRGRGFPQSLFLLHASVCCAVLTAVTVF